MIYLSLQFIRDIKKQPRFERRYLSQSHYFGKIIHLSNLLGRFISRITIYLAKFLLQKKHQKLYNPREVQADRTVPTGRL